MNNIALKILGIIAMLILLLIAILLVVTFSDAVDSKNIVIVNFISVLFNYPFIIPACLIFLPSLLWKQSMFLAYSLVLGLLLIVPSAQVIYVLYGGYSRVGFGGVLGMAVLFILGFSYIMGIIIRAVFFPTTKNSTDDTPSEFSFKTADIVARNSRDKKILANPSSRIYEPNPSFKRDA